MMRLLRRLVCRVVGHDWIFSVPVSAQSRVRCLRCGKVRTPTQVEIFGLAPPKF